MIGFVRGKASHIAGGAVTVVSDHGQLLLRSEIHLADRRNGLDAFQCRIGFGSVRHPLANPPRDEFPFVRSGRHALSAAMRKNISGLLQQKTEVRIRRKYTTTAIFVHKIFVVFLWIESQQRQLKAVLSVRLAMTSASVATKLCEDRNDFVFEIHRQFFRTTRRTDNLRRRLPRCHFRRDRRRAIRSRYDQAFRIDIQHCRNINCICHVMRQIMPLTAGIDACDDQLPACVLPDHRRRSGGFEFDLDQIALRPKPRRLLCRRLRTESDQETQREKLRHTGETTSHRTSRLIHHAKISIAGRGNGSSAL